ncbi:MAG TPA: hypothetical protein VKB63_12000 [Gemmatimonadales bacterium]|nr:hypothetical protein [Gemmatimonadales bacterium]
MIRLAALVSAALSLLSAPAVAQFYRFQYAAKIVCGKPPDHVRLVPQVYATAINVHNPIDTVTFVLKKLALTSPPGRQRPGKVIPITTDTLRGNEAFATDCQDIAARTGVGNTFEGFVVLESNFSIDVTAVYAVPGGIDVEQIKERVLR